MNLEHARSLVESYGPVAVGIGSTLDNTGVPIFFVAGLVAAAATGAQSSNLVAMFAAAILGSIIGDLVVYAIGRYVLTKERILSGSFGQSFRPVMEAGDKFMARWGFWSIVFGRFVPYVGKVIPVLAGSYKRSWWQVVPAVCLGTVMLMGLCFGLEDTVVAMVMGGASGFRSFSLTVGMLFLFGLWWYNRKLQSRALAEMKAKAEAGSAEDPAGQLPAKRSRYRQE
jgi:membrane protein DedA with SNARE-associated domain